MLRLGWVLLVLCLALLSFGCDSQGSSSSSSLTLNTAPVTAVTLNTGTWVQTARSAPEALTGIFLLSDGTVMAQGPWVSKNWYKLTPDASGGYVQGSWTPMASMSLERLYYASGVLPNGKIYILGGEYTGPGETWDMDGTGEIYDPLTNSWSAMAEFPENAFGDDPSQLLPDGRILAGFFGSEATYLYNPITNAWTPGPNKLFSDRSDEETWVKLPDDSALTYDIFGGDNGNPRSAQRYVPSLNQWVSAGVSPVPLEDSNDEVGPAVRLPTNGKVFYVGAVSNTALYTPPATLTGSGSWEAGPTIPFSSASADAPAAVLPNGHVMFVASGIGGSFPTQLMDYDPVTNSIVIAQTPPAMNLSGLVPYEFRMLVLPTGQLLITTDEESRPWIFTAVASGHDPAWEPTVSTVTQNPDGSYTLSGTQLNGLDEGSAYGDDFENSTNYPLVRITDSAGVIRYARTFNWSSVGVATGSVPVSTRFTLPQGVASGSGSYQLNVVANGISSAGFVFVP